MNNDTNKILRLIFYTWILLLVLLIYPLQQDPVTPIKSFVTCFSFLLMSFVITFQVVFEKKRLSLNVASFLLSIAFIGIYLLATVFSDYPVASLLSLKYWLLLFFIWFIFIQAFKEVQHLEFLLKFIVYTVAVSCFYAVLQSLSFDFFPWEKEGIDFYSELPSTFGNPNLAGHVLLIALIIAISLLMRKIQPTIFIALLLIVFHFLKTEMRSIRLALIVAFAIMLMHHFFKIKVKNPIRSITITLIICMGVVLSSLFFLSINFEKLVSKHYVTVDLSSLIRVNSYVDACKMIIDKPCVGHGPGRYEHLHIPYWSPFQKDRYATQKIQNRYLHFEILETGIETGFIGIFIVLLLFLWFSYNSLLLLYSTSEKVRWIGFVTATSLFAIAVDSCFGYNIRFIVSGGFFFLIFGILVSLQKQIAIKGKINYIIAFFILFNGIFLFYVESHVFYSEILYQRAKGALNWSKIAKKNNQFDQAVKYSNFAYTKMLQASQINPLNYHIKQDLGIIAVNNQSLGIAQQHFADALKISPHHPYLLYYMSETYFRKGIQQNLPNNENLKKSHEYLQYSKANCPHLLITEDLETRIHKYQKQNLSD